MATLLSRIQGGAPASVGCPMETPLGVRAPELDGARLHDLGLSPREIEVLTLCCRGLINDAIGLELGISPRTVQKHLERVHAKLGVGTRTAAVAIAYALSQDGR